MQGGTRIMEAMVLKVQEKEVQILRTEVHPKFLDFTVFSHDDHTVFNSRIATSYVPLIQQVMIQL